MYLQGQKTYRSPFRNLEQTTSLTIGLSFKLQKVDPYYFRFPFLFSIFLARFFVVCKSFHNINFLCFTKDPGKPKSNCGVCFRNCIYIFLQSSQIWVPIDFYLQLILFYCSLTCQSFFKQNPLGQQDHQQCAEKDKCVLLTKYVGAYIKLCHISDFQFLIQTLSLNKDLDFIWYTLPKSYATKVTLTTNNYLCSMKLLPAGNEAPTKVIYSKYSKH